MMPANHRPAWLYCRPAETVGYTPANLERPDLRPDTALPERKIAKADTRAEQMHLQHFAESPNSEARCHPLVAVAVTPRQRPILP